MSVQSPKSEITPRTVIPYRRRRISWRSLNWQILFITILPVTALVLLVAVGSLSVHQNAMRNMVGERDMLAIGIAATAIDEQIAHREQLIESLAVLAEKVGQEQFEEILQQPAYLKSEFDAGVAIFSKQGELIATSVDSPLWPDFSSTVLELNQKQVSANQTQQAFIQVAQLPHDDHLILRVFAVSPSRQWVATGMTSISGMIDTALNQAFSSKTATSIILVVGEHGYLYQRGAAPYEPDFQLHPGIQEALNGKSGVLYTRDQKNELVVTYSPVGALGWALVFQEAWETVESPVLRTSQLAPLILAPVLILTIIALGFGARQIITPLQKLEAKASLLAGGDFEAIKKPVGGIDEIRQLQDELIQMAQKVRAAQRNLHNYIGSITSAQEDERLRLARELHDETIQALIALKQRAQLYQLTAARSEEESTSLAEIAGLTEETIKNLRRLIHDLRPIYLEDLGLTTALEMLSRENKQKLGIPVTFHKEGNEKRLPAQVELAVFRIAQEAFRNIEWHAQATRAELTIKFDPESLVIAVSDEGKGFEVPRNPSEFAHTGHFGILGMVERAELIAARLDIQSYPEKGTRIELHIPIQSN